MFIKFKSSNLSDAISELQDYIVEKDEKMKSFWILEVKKARAKASLSARGYYWVICTQCAIKIGCTKEAVHKMICLENHADIIKLPNGKIKLIPKETKEMKSDEFAQLITKARMWAQQELDLYIHTPEEWVEENRIRMLNEYERMFH